MKNLAEILRGMDPDIVRPTLDSSRRIYIPRLRDQKDKNQLLLSLLAYDKVVVDADTFVVDFLGHLPRQFHYPLIGNNQIEIKTVRSPECNPLKETYHEFMHAHSYSTQEMSNLIDYSESRIECVVQHSTAELSAYLFQKYPGDGIDLLKTISFAKCNELSMDMGYRRHWEGDDFMIDDKNDFLRSLMTTYSMPDLYERAAAGAFELSELLELGEGPGGAILKRLLFDKNIDSAESARREFEFILGGMGKFSSSWDMPCWGISTALSVVGLLFPFPFSVVFATGSIGFGSYPLVRRTATKSLKKFVEHDLESFSERIRGAS